MSNQFKVTIAPGKDVFVNSKTFQTRGSSEVVFEDEYGTPTHYFTNVISVIKTAPSSK